MSEEISVYMFLGFLESGKTRFIQETLEDPRMENGERTMVLVCEEGEEEYDPHTFKVKNVAIEYLDDRSQLTAQNLSALAEKHQCDRVIVEYNGHVAVAGLLRRYARRLGYKPDDDLLRFGHVFKL